MDKTKSSKVAIGAYDRRAISEDNAERMFRILEAQLKLELAFWNKPYKGVWFKSLDELYESLDNNKAWGNSGYVSLFKDAYVTFSKAAKVIEVIKENECNVFLVAMFTKKNEPRIRKIGKDDTVNLLQGRSPKETNYVGDRYWYKEKNDKFAKTVVIQIHWITGKSPTAEKEIFKSCVLLPIELINQLNVKSS